MSRTRWTYATSLLLALSGCPEVAPPRDAGVDQSSPVDSGVAMMDATSPIDTGIQTDAGSVTADGDSASEGMARVTINEIRAESEDWIELYNAGTAPADLSGWGVTDSFNDMDARVMGAARFPAGTMLAPGAYLLVVVDMNDAGTGPQMRCLTDGGPMTCYHGTFGISASRGEAVHLIDPSDRVFESALYPPNAAMPGESWGRLPNGTGSFARNRLTPGAPNAAP
jgi:hypothetical protein